MKTLIDLHEDLRKWFSKTDPAGDWKRINSKGEVVGPCAREPGEPKPKCMSRAKRESLTKKERAAAVRAKRKHDPDPERKGKPINVSNFGKGKISEDMENLNEKNVPTNPELWSRAKSLARSKFDVYPSAYANGWASKWYKSKGGSWKTVSEAVKDKFDIGEYDQEGDMAKSDLRSIMANAQKLHDMIEDADNLPEWCQNKITLAEDYISTVANYLTAEMSESDVYGKPTTEKTPTVTLKHKDSGKEIVVVKSAAPGYRKIGYHMKTEEFVKTGKEATHNKTGEKTYEYAKVDKEGRKTGEREYRNAQGKPMGEEFAGYIAHYNGQKHEIKSHEAKDLYGAKQKAIAHFKIPKSKHGLLSVKPGYNEETVEVDKNGLDEVASYKTLQKRYSNVEQKYGDESKKDYPSVKGRSVMKKIARTAYKQHGMFLQKNEDVEQINEISKDDHAAQDVYDKAHMAYMDKYHKNVPPHKQRAAEAEAHKHASAIMKKQYPHHIASKGEGQVYRLSKEETQIDEITQKLAGNYLSKVTQQNLQKHGMQHDMYGKLAKNRQQGVSNAFKRLQVDKEGKPVHHLVTKEETVEEQLYKQGRFVTGAGKKPFKAPTLVSPRVDESRGHKVLSTFFKNREVAQRAYQGNPAHDSTVAAGGGTPADQGIAAAKRDAKKVVKESRKAEIVKEIMKKKKSDKFESEPELSNTQSKSDQTV